MQNTPAGRVAEFVQESRSAMSEQQPEKTEETPLVKSARPAHQISQEEWEEFWEQSEPINFTTPVEDSDGGDE